VLFSDADIDPASTAFKDGVMFFHDRDPQKIHEKARELKTVGRRHLLHGDAPVPTGDAEGR